MPLDGNTFTQPAQSSGIDSLEGGAGGTFNMLQDPASIDWGKTARENRRSVDRLVKFMEVANHAFGDGSIQELVFGNGQDFSIENLGAQELTFIFKIFNEKADVKTGNGFREMIEIYQRSQDDVFTKSDDIIALVAVAYNKTGLPDKAKFVAQDLKGDENTANRERLAALGKSHKLKYSQARKKLELGVVDRVERAMLEKQMQDEFTRAYKEYEKAFKVDYHYYPGVNLLYLLYNSADPIWQARGKNLIPLIRAAAENDGGIDSKDYWCAVTTLELACLDGASVSEVEPMLSKVLDQADVGWKISSTIDAEHLGKVKNPAAEYVCQELQKRISDLESGKKPEKHKETNPRGVNLITRGIEQYSSRYTGLVDESSFVSGNWEWGGQLRERSVNRKDYEFYDRLLDYLNLTPEVSYDEFVTRSHVFVRDHFNTKDLEDARSEAHHRFDDIQKVQVPWSGVQHMKGSISRSSVTADFISREGDCRHHGDTTQLLWDRFQRRKVTAVIADAYDKVVTSSPVEGKHVAEIAQIETYEAQREEMRLFTVKISGHMKFGSDGYPARDSHGQLIFSEEVSGNAEPHTMTFVIERDAKGNVTSMRLRDSFYQKYYPFGDLRLDPKDILTTDGKEGGFSITVQGVDEQGNNKDISLTLTPQQYGGKSDKKNLVDPTGSQMAGRPVNLKGLTPALVCSKEYGAAIRQSFDRLRDFAKH